MCSGGAAGGVSAGGVRTTRRKKTHKGQRTGKAAEWTTTALMPATAAVGVAHLRLVVMCVLLECRHALEEVGGALVKARLVERLREPSGA